MMTQTSLFITSIYILLFVAESHAATLCPIGQSPSDIVHETCETTVHRQNRSQAMISACLSLIEPSPNTQTQQPQGQNVGCVRLPHTYSAPYVCHMSNRTHQRPWTVLVCDHDRMSAAACWASVRDCALRPECAPECSGTIMHSVSTNPQITLKRNRRQTAETRTSDTPQPHAEIVPRWQPIAIIVLCVCVCALCFYNAGCALYKLVQHCRRRPSNNKKTSENADTKFSPETAAAVRRDHSSMESPTSSNEAPKIVLSNPKVESSRTEVNTSMYDRHVEALKQSALTAQDHDQSTEASSSSLAVTCSKDKSLTPEEKKAALISTSFESVSAFKPNE